MRAPVTPQATEPIPRFARAGYSLRYHTYQRQDPVTGLMRNLRPMQWPALMKPCRHIVYIP